MAILKKGASAKHFILRIPFTRLLSSPLEPSHVCTVCVHVFSWPASELMKRKRALCTKQSFSSPDFSGKGLLLSHFLGLCMMHSLGSNPRYVTGDYKGGWVVELMETEFYGCADTSDGHEWVVRDRIQACPCISWGSIPDTHPPMDTKH